jgi:hypothetical protein
VLDYQRHGAIISFVPSRAQWPRLTQTYQGTITMTTNITTLTRAAALSLALALPAVAGFGTSAFADDEYGSNRSPSILSSAQSVFAANPADTQLARATAAAKAASSTYAANRSTVMSDAKVGGVLDLNGQGGPQDQLGRQIYTPGSGTDW